MSPEQTLRQTKEHRDNLINSRDNLSKQIAGCIETIAILEPVVAARAEAAKASTSPAPKVDGAN